MHKLLTLLLACSLPVFNYLFAQACDPIDIFSNKNTNAVCIEVVNNVRVVHTNNLLSSFHSASLPA